MPRLTAAALCNVSVMAAQSLLTTRRSRLRVLQTQLRRPVNHRSLEAGIIANCRSAFASSLRPLTMPSGMRTMIWPLSSSWLNQRPIQSTSFPRCPLLHAIRKAHCAPCQQNDGQRRVALFHGALQVEQWVSEVHLKPAILDSYDGAAQPGCGRGYSAPGQ